MLEKCWQHLFFAFDNTHHVATGMKMNQHYQLWQDPPFSGWSLWCLIKISYKTYIKDNPLRCTQPISVAEKNQPVSSSNVFWRFFAKLPINFWVQSPPIFVGYDCVTVDICTKWYWNAGEVPKNWNGSLRRENSSMTSTWLLCTLVLYGFIYIPMTLVSITTVGWFALASSFGGWFQSEKETSCPSQPKSKRLVSTLCGHWTVYGNGNSPLRTPKIILNHC